MNDENPSESPAEPAAPVITSPAVKAIAIVGILAILSGAFSLTIIGFFAVARHNRIPSWPLWLLGLGLGCWLVVARLKKRNG